MLDHKWYLTSNFTATSKNYWGRPQKVQAMPSAFARADVCKVLEISNPSMAKKRLDQRSLSTAEVANAAGFMRESAIVNESGLYDVILDHSKNRP